MFDEQILNSFNLMGNEKSFLKKYNNIYISEEQYNILKKYNIYVEKYNNIKELIYDIEQCINNSLDDIQDLEWVSQTLDEYNYYNNVNK